MAQNKKRRGTRRKLAFQKNNQNRAAMILITAIVIMVVVVIGVSNAGLRQKKAEYEKTRTELQAKIDTEQERAENLVEFEKYTQTDKYKEELAKETFGLVYEDEILFVTEGS